VLVVPDEWRDHSDVGEHESHLRARRPRAGVTGHRQSLWYDLPRT